MTRIKQHRLVAMVTALALTLAVAAPAVAEPLALSGGWVTSGLDQLARWWSTVWGSPPVSAGAASEGLPNLDPAGAVPQPGDPDEASLVDGQEPTNEGDVLPNLDPNG